MFQAEGAAVPQEHAIRLAETAKACVSWSGASRGHCLVREVKGGQVTSDLHCNLASSEADSEVEFGWQVVYQRAPPGLRPVVGGRVRAAVQAQPHGALNREWPFRVVLCWGKPSGLEDPCHPVPGYGLSQGGSGTLHEVTLPWRVILQQPGTQFF